MVSNETTLSLQKKINLEKIYPTRNKMILEHKLHIQDSITYEEFKKLFNQYGNGIISEIEFARYFLDIDYRSWYNLQSGYRETTSILERQYYEYSELDLLEENFLSKTDFKPGDKIDYQELLELHKNFGGFFSLKIFADEILGLNAHAVDDMSYNKNLRKTILKKEKTNRKEIFETRNRIALETGYHTKQQITLEEFKELYKKYSTSEISDRIFALKILGITTDTFLRFSKGKRPNATIFPTFSINPKYVSELREKVILEENLHIDDPVTPEEFENLYEKYGGILTQELFAEEILDVSFENVKNARRRKQNVYILRNIDYEEWLIDFREKILQENSLTHYDELSLAQVKELYKKYPSLLSEKMFAVEVLLIPDYNYGQLTRGTTYESKILVDKSEKDFEEIRKRVIEENNLHYDDKMEYYEVDRLHKLYAPTVQEHIFANRILDIPQGQLDNIRHNKGNAYTHILLSEPLPSKEELKILKRKVIYSEKLHRRDSIDYETFKRLYKTYGGIMPEDMFAEQILDILNTGLTKIKSQPEEGKKPRTQILLRTNMSQKEISKLREQIFIENSFYPGKSILLKDAIAIYQKYPHILYPREFYRMVLHINGKAIGNFDGVDESVLNESFTIGETNRNSWNANHPLSNNEIKQIKTYLINNYTREQIAVYLYRPLDKTNQLIEELVNRKVISLEECKFESVKKLYFTDKRTLTQIKKESGLPIQEIQDIIKEIQRKKKTLKKLSNQKQTLEDKAGRILDRFDYETKNVKLVTSYIDKCMELYGEVGYPREKLDFLGECISFVQGGSDQIKFFTQVCISYREYDRAINFISQNIDNETVQKNEKNDLRKLQKELKYARAQEKAVDIFIKENATPEVVAKRTGILLVDAIKLKRKMQQKSKRRTNPNGDDKDDR